MMQLTDEQLLELLRSRLSQKRSTLSEVEMFRQLETLGSKLKESEELKSHFLSNIRNEVNNPMASLLGISRTLLNADKLERQQITRYAYLVHNELFNLDFQMKNIFAAAEIEAGEMKPQASLTDVQQLIGQVQEMLKFKADRKRVVIDCSFAPTGLLLFETDPNMVHLIVMNLLANAIEFSRDGGNVHLLITISDQDMVVSVRDSGMGISSLNQDKIFQRFKQLDEGSTKHHGGHGLGLAIIKELVDLLQGDLQIHSEPGVGSQFTVSIPTLPSSGYMRAKSEGWNEFMFGSDIVL